MLKRNAYGQTIRRVLLGVWCAGYAMPVQAQSTLPLKASHNQTDGQKVQAKGHLSDKKKNKPVHAIHTIKKAHATTQPAKSAQTFSATPPPKAQDVGNNPNTPPAVPPTNTPQQAPIAPATSVFIGPEQRVEPGAMPAPTPGDGVASEDAIIDERMPQADGFDEPRPLTQSRMSHEVRQKPYRLMRATFGTSYWGGRGLYRVYSAFAAQPHALTLNFGDEYFQAKNIFEANDQDSEANLQVHVAFVPVRGFEIGISQASRSNRYSGTTPRTLQIQGDPMLHLKYGYTFFDDLAVGVYVGMQLPTAQWSTGLSAVALKIPAKLLLSYNILDWVEIDGNVGYTFDRSRQLSSLNVDDPLARFVFQVNLVNQLTYGLGAKLHLSAADFIDFAPYVEVSGGLGFGDAATRQNSPLRGSLGLKTYLAQSRSVELNLGADMRFGGAPAENSPFSGLPPWAIFGQLAFHLGERLPTYQDDLNRTCDTDAQCGDGAVCWQNHCLDGGGPTQSSASFVLAGRVIDGTTHEPVGGARLTFADFENTMLATDPISGQFVSWPLAVQSPRPLQVHISAPGYAAIDMTLQRGKVGDIKQVTLALDSGANIPVGTVQGTIKDGHSGNPLVHATVFFPTIQKQLHSGPDGSFSTDLNVGEYQVIISARNYQTQRKKIQVLNGDVVFLNTDLLPLAPRNNKQVAPDKVKQR